MTADDMTKKWIRRIGLGFAALLLLSIAAAVFLITTFDANAYKAQAIDWMKAERHRNLAIDGPIELSVFPKLAVKVSGVRLSERNSDAPFLTIENAALSVRTLPLLRGQLVVDRVSARGVHVDYRRDAGGSRNFDDLLGKQRDPGMDGKDSGSSEGSWRFDVSSIGLEDLRLKVSDAMAGLAGDVTVESFKSGRLANQVETPVSFTATVVLSKPQALDLKLAGRMNLEPDLDRSGLALRDMKLEVAGDAAGIRELAMTLDGALAWEGGRLQAGPLKVALASAGFGQNRLGASTVEVKRMLFDPDGKRLELDAFETAIAGSLGQDAFELALTWPTLAVDQSKLTGSGLSGRYKLAGSIALAGKFHSGAPTGNFEALRLPALDIRLEGSSGRRRVDGFVKADALLKFGSKAVAIENLDLQADLTDPSLQPLKIALRGRFDAQAQAASWNVAGALNANRFESDGRAMLGGRVPRIIAKARFDSLDLNNVLVAERPGATPAPTSPGTADAPIDFDGLRAIDGNLSFAAGTFAYRQYEVVDARMEAVLDDGVLRISRLTGRTWGGTVAASGSVVAGSQRFVVKLDADGVDINELLNDVARKDLLEGRGRVQADIATHGATLAAMRSNLAGGVSFRLRDGAIKGINLAQTLRQAKAALSMRQDAVSQARQTEKTDFSELSASARISDGIARSDDLDLKSPFLRVGGSGTFDIGKGRIDYTARTTLTASATGQGGADLGALRGVTIPVSLSGPFEAIDWNVRWSEVAASAVTNALRDKLAETLGAKLGTAPPAAAGGTAPASQKPRDVLKEQLLKGLFK